MTSLSINVHSSNSLINCFLNGKTNAEILVIISSDLPKICVSTSLNNENNFFESIVVLNFFSYLERKAISSQKALNLVPRLHSWNVKNSKLLPKYIFKLFRNNKTRLKRKRHGWLDHKVFVSTEIFCETIFFYFSSLSLW